MHLDQTNKSSSKLASWYKIPDEALEDSELIQRFAKEGVPADILGKFELPIARKTRGWRSPRGEPASPFAPKAICYGTDTAMNLTYGGEAVATIAYETDSRDKSAIVIRQLQGAPGAQAELQSLRWEILLINALIQLARGLRNIEEIRIPPAEAIAGFESPVTPLEGDTEEGRKEWHRKRDSIRERMKLIYNVIPERIGFVWDKELQCRRYPLSKRRLPQASTERRE